MEKKGAALSIVLFPTGIFLVIRSEPWAEFCYLRMHDLVTENVPSMLVGRKKHRLPNSKIK